VVKYKSPAIIGFGDGEYYLSSDITALGGKAKTCAVLEDGDIAIIGRDGAKIYDSQLQAVARRREEVLSDGLEFSLGGCPHYMLKEIREDSDAIKNTCDGLLKLSNLTEICAQIKGAKSVILIGCGTAYNSALLASVWLKNCLACSVEVAVAGEARYFPPRADKDTVVLAISQSGETADTVEAANLLKGKGAKLFAVTNAPRSALTRIADCVLPVCAGSEICVAATKSYLGQLACLYLLCGCICGSIDERGQKLFDCAEKINKVVWGDLGLKRIARACANSRAVFFLGRGEDYAVAVEGSLKLKEVSYIFSDAYPAGELKHGTLALIDDSTLSIIIICNERVAEKSLNAAEEILSRKGKVAIITTLPYIAKSFESKIENIMVLPSCDSELNTLTSSAALQLVAYYCALELGRNPDKPRNLAKSVTVE
jgi:glucosamine--fructose-6-phosphate aminotransferase (isomerizing)